VGLRFKTFLKDVIIQNIMEIKLGKYKHFKGNIYDVIGIAKYSEDPSQNFVIYRHINGDEKDQFWARPIEMFTENVETENYKGPRFKFLEE
jgi:hypothetical protein